MSGSTKPWFAVAALAITALLAIAADRLTSFVMRELLVDGGKWWPHAATAFMFAVFVCVFMGIAVKRRRGRRVVRRSDSSSVQNELDMRKLRARGARVQFR